MLKIGSTYKFLVNSKIDGKGTLLGYFYLGANNETLLFEIDISEQRYGFTYDTMCFRFHRFPHILELMTGNNYYTGKFFTCDKVDVLNIDMKEWYLKNLKYLYK